VFRVPRVLLVPAIAAPVPKSLARRPFRDTIEQPGEDNMTRRTAIVLALLAVATPTVLTRAQPAPAAAAEVLMAADRAYAAAGANTDAVSALTAMFAPDVIMPGPPAALHRGLAAATAALRTNPDNVDGRVEWTPIRVGLSADGQHGFTFGFMTQHRKDGTQAPLKYMAYWVKGATGWRVAGYKRARRAEGEVSTAVMAPLVPATLVAPSTDAARGEALRTSLSEAERAFSDESQTVGLGAAFTKWGSETAVNMGGPNNAGYAVGAAAIGKNVGSGAPGPTSPVEWSTDVAIVASSGDLGISFGFIRPNAKPADGKTPQGNPFFTIWYRATPAGPWRYIAE
jgi:ketosteroid isomerase-like protein